jgi:hypothetical protein
MRLLLGAILATFLAACSSGVFPRPSGNLDDLEKFIAIPVEERFAQARAAGDRRFIGVYDFALSVPGVPNYHEEYWPGTGVLPIPGTSDSHESDRESELNEKARAYALKCNALLLRPR